MRKAPTPWGATRSHRQRSRATCQSPYSSGASNKSATSIKMITTRM